MWNNKKKWLYYFLILFLFFVSCKTQKIVKTEIQTKDSIRNALEYNTFNVSKTTFTLAQKQSSFNVNGSIRIRKDSIIVLSFQPFLGVEMVRADITQNSFTLVDRINKRYFTSDFESLKERLGVEVNYNIFQSIFTNSLFVYDAPGAVSYSAFKEVYVGDLLLLQTGKNGVNQEFSVGDKWQVRSGRIFNESYSLHWDYLKFVPLEDGYLFPHQVTITLSDGKVRNQLDVSYNKVELNKSLNFQFSVPSSYTKVTWEELLQILR